jgi:hypothetical protein
MMFLLVDVAGGWAEFGLDKTSQQRGDLDSPREAPAPVRPDAAMRHTSDDRHGWWLRAMIVVLWRAGFRIQEALAMTEHDLNERRGSIMSASAGLRL